MASFYRTDAYFSREAPPYSMHVDLGTWIAA